MKQVSRQLNVELLRGILMLMICALHVIGINILDDKNPIDESEYNFYISNFFESAFVMAVDCFVLISGYFGIRASVKKYLLFIAPIVLYTLGIYICVHLVTGNFSKDIVYSVFPVLSNRYWFVTVYAVMFIVSPLLNIVVERLSRKQYETTLIIGLLFFVIVPTFTPFSLTSHDRGFGVVNFCLLYFIGSYIHKYVRVKENNKLRYLVCYIAAVLLIFMGNISQGYFFSNHGWKTHFNAYDGLFVYTAAISFFLLFRTIRCNWQAIGYLSPSFFYVYIIHENPYLRHVIYDMLKCECYYQSPFWITHMIASSVIIFIVCVAIDLLRRMFTERGIAKLVEKLSQVIHNRIITSVEYFIQSKRK